MSHSRSKREMMMKDLKPKTDKWIKNAINPERKGALHRALDVPMGEKISEKKLKKAEHSKNSLTRKRANLADTLRGFHH
jgi:hypothetical protein